MQACDALPGDNPWKGYGVYATYFNYHFIYARATACGLPAGTVTLTPPAPSTCDGAYTRFMGFEM